MRRSLSVGFNLVGAALLAVGLLAGVVNHNVLDVPRLTAHVEAMRTDPAVARQVGRLVTDQVLSADSDLVAIRPLIEASATSLVSSSAFGPVVRSTTRQLAQAMLDPNSEPLVLRLADAGAVITATIRTVAPAAAARLPAGLDVTLARVGSHTFPATVVRWVHLVRLLAWLLPLLALLCFAAALVVAPSRRRAVGRVGVGVMAAGAAVLLLTLAATGWAATASTETLRGALAIAAWGQLAGSLWWTAIAALVAGSLLLATSTALLPQIGVTAPGRRVWAFLASRPTSTRAGVVHGLSLVALGLALLLHAQTLLWLLAVGLGVVLLNAGLAEVAVLAGGRGPDPAPESRQDGARGRRRWRGWRRWRLPAALGCAALAVLLPALVLGGASDTSQVPSRRAVSSTACNGSAQLCDRRYDQVAFPATHNSMAAASEPGWFIPEQPVGIIGQLDAGIRVFLIDSWYGQRTTRTGVIATAKRNHEAALAQANHDYGKAVVDSALRVRRALDLTPTGPEIPFLCHGLCELGATEWEPVMAQVNDWLEAHPREVVTFFIQDMVSPADTAKVFREAGLLPSVATPVRGRPWPTLGQMIDSGKRVVVLMEKHGGGSTDPWLLQGFDWVQDTPFTNPTAASLSCARNRGSDSSPILLLNYWLSNLHRVVSDAERINAYDVLEPYLRTCQRERGMVPNFVAVNYFDRGDLFRAVERINGIHPSGQVAP